MARRRRTLLLRSLEPTRWGVFGSWESRGFGVQARERGRVQRGRRGHGHGRRERRGLVVSSNRGNGHIAPFNCVGLSRASLMVLQASAATESTAWFNYCSRKVLELR